MNGWTVATVVTALTIWSPLPASAQELPNAAPNAKELDQAVERMRARANDRRAARTAPVPSVTDKAISTDVSVARGDVVTVGGRRYRIWGIATPAPNEYGGYTSARELARLTSGGKVTCVTTGALADGLPLARCRVDGRDLAATMVAGGFARDCPRQSRGTYAAIERDVVADVAGGFDLPPGCLED